MITNRAYEYSTNVPTKRMCWYVLPSSEAISARVGHSAIYVSESSGNETADQKDASAGLIYVVGGADPSGVYNEEFTLNLASQSFEKLRTKGAFEGRYEHACVLVNGEKKRLWIWAGAVQTGNLNDLLELELDTRMWRTVAQKGEVPVGRTCHLVANGCNGHMAVFSGGEQGTMPVDDEQVHVLDVHSQAWSTVTREAGRKGSSPRGGRPKARQGHVSVLREDSNGCKLLVHAGLAGYTFFDDLWQFDVTSCQWERMHYANAAPCGRAAHAGALHGSNLYVFGGLTEHGALNELWKFELDSNQWTLVDMRGAVPSARLCFAMCLCEMPVRLRKGQREPDEASMSSVNVSMNETMLLDAANECVSLGGSLSARSEECAMSARLKELRLQDEYESHSGPPSARSDTDGDALDSSRSTQSRQILDEALYERSLLPALFIHGGMNTEGDMFDDAYICVLP